MRWNLLLEAATETVTQAATEAAESTAANPMDMVQMLDVLMVVMLLGCGVYALYSALKLKKLCYLFPNGLLYPGNCKPEDCTDAPSFILYIVPRAVLLGIGMIIIGGLFLLNMLVFKIDALWVNLLSIVLPLALFAWYVVAQRKAGKRFW